ncbi:hypothetical protein C6359_17475 [Bacillus wiedmannii]|uniref:Uncharacterized protein n=1 Tax=Bacillus wiedmannii TaxID=1890302 RepID=A0A2C4Q189_9BACI|nr:hypothetical protein COF57_19920 [Bacillus wiedmannii]PRT07004.1 hypothetical protein C6356_00860 [Bacillus wiedmannii]PRT32883.1 hypothetical protein C6358_17370 [Bacillus wiedmannii]PRT38127.1 hypothetical protein C6357_20545 [Bacillus wiedmannii]PRT44369.1 hypothetical protein C6359_17475 [Bacillus wiedmannii]
MVFLFILFTILTVVIARHTSSPFMLITTYYVRRIRNVWTSYCFSTMLVAYLYTSERKHINKTTI